MTPNHDETTEKVPVEVITPGVYTTTQTSAVIDMLDFEAATLLLHIGVGGITFTGTNKITVSLTAGDASDGSDQAAVAASDIITDALAPATITAGVIRSLTSLKAAADVQKLGYIGGHRYAQLTITFAGTHGTGTPIAATLVKEDGLVMGAA